jgi:hypothetical protein
VLVVNSPLQVWSLNTQLGFAGMELHNAQKEALTSQVKMELTVPRPDKKHTIGKLFERAFI